MSHLPIKIILICLLFLVLRAFLVQRSMELAKRFFGLVLFLVVILLVLFPDISTRLANAVGVGRGVDLVFYLASLFLLLLIVALWRRAAMMEAEITKLSRMIAILNAKKPAKKE